jgi:hypothetical protein
MVLLLIFLIPNGFPHFLNITILPIIIILPLVILFIPPTIIRVHHLITNFPLIILGILTILPRIFCQLIFLEDYKTIYRNILDLCVYLQI